MATHSETLLRWQRHPWANRDEDGRLGLDVAIVGAGVSGLYSGYRLAKAGLDFIGKMGVFDASHRIGGRINSIVMPGTELVADIGAMRYLPNQLLINGLVQHFRIKPYLHSFPLHSYFVRGRDLVPPSPQSVNSASPPRRPINERRPLASEEGPSFDIAEQSAYRWLREDEIGLGPGHLVALAIAKSLEKISVSLRFNEDLRFQALGDTSWFQKKVRSAAQKKHSLTFGFFTPKEWQAIKEHVVFEDQPLYRISFWDLVQSSLSNEAYKLIEEGLGYQTIIGTWNAAEAIPWFLADFSEENYYSLPGGMSSLVKHLTNGLVESLESHVQNIAFDQIMHLGHALREVNKVEVDEPPGFAYDLVFECYDEHVPEPHRFGSAQGIGISRTVRAKQVILALPQGALSRLKFGGIKLDVVKKSNPDLRWTRLLDSVTAHPLVKMFALFRTTWWTACRDELRPSTFENKLTTNHASTLFDTCKIFTDLPLRMLYYHGPATASRRSHEPASQTNHGMIVAYCDARHAAYWDSLNRLDEKKQCDPDLWARLVDGNDADALGIIRRYGVSHLFARRMHEQLQRYHGRYGGVREEAKPDLVLYMNWSHPPYFGGWHSWNLVAAGDGSPTAVREAIRCPFKGEEIFVCGEAFSQDQGWIEGALRSAEAVLCRPPFQLSQPHWGSLGAALKSHNYDTFDDYVNW